MAFSEYMNFNSGTFRQPQGLAGNSKPVCFYYSSFSLAKPFCAVCTGIVWINNPGLFSNLCLCLSMFNCLTPFCHPISDPSTDLESLSQDRPHYLQTCSCICTFCWEGFCLQVNLCQMLLFLQNKGRTCCVHKLF